MSPCHIDFPLVGTWKITESRSSRPDLPHPVSGTSTWTQAEDGVHYQSTHTWSDGRTSNVTSVHALDGEWYPLAGSALADSISLRRLEDGSVEALMRRKGVPAGSTRATISPNGKSLAALWEITAPDGSTAIWNTLSERQ